MPELISRIVTLGVGGVLVLADAGDGAVIAAEDPAVARGIVEERGEDRDGVAFALVG